jgi:WD40 repeat protein
MKVIRTLKGHHGWITGLAFSPDGSQLAVAGEHGQLRVWDLNAEEEALPRLLHGHIGVVYSVAFNDDGSVLASAGADQTIRLWDLSTPDSNRELTGHTGAVLSVAFNHDSSLLASGSADKTVQLWDLTAPEPTSRIIGRHTDKVCRVMFNNVGSFLASAGADRTVQLRRIPSGGLQHTLNSHSGRITGIAFSPDGEQLASADWVEDSLVIWNLADGKPEHTIDGVSCSCGQAEWVLDVAYSPSGILAATGPCDGSIRRWEIASGSMMPQLTGHKGPVSSLTFSSDGKLASGGGRDHQVRIWSESSSPASQSL